MSFFKDFKADFTQAMNELMPEGNEVYEDDVEELLNEVSQEEADTPVTIKTKEKKEKVAKEKPVKNKKKSRQTEETDLQKPEREIDISEDQDGLDIAPEDMLDQIDSLLDNELYSDEPMQSNLISDDVEVNTMDMTLEELLQQLDTSSVPSEPEDKETIPVSEESEQTEMEASDFSENSVNTEPEDGLNESINDLLAELDEKAILHSVEMEDLPDEVIKEPEEEEEYNQIIPEQEEPLEEVFTEPEEEYLEEVVVETEDTEEIVDVEETETEVSELEEEPESSMENMEEDNLDIGVNEEETIAENTEISTEPVLEETVLTDDLPEEENQEESEPDIEVEFYEDKEQYEGTNNSIVNVEGDTMNQENDVISIKSVEEKSTKPVVDESSYHVDEADSETTYITKGTIVSGNIETDGSIDIIGTINGDVNCKGKVVVGGSVAGSVTAGELYCNSAKIEGDIKSYGSVKIGVGSMIIGNIEGESAVIAGAVNGDIDVKGPVIVDSTAVIMGNIKSRSVQINNGAVIEGFCSQSYSDIDVKSFFA